MLPRQRERIQAQLLRWGYPPYIVENMEPFSLISHYNHELKKRAQKLAEQDGVLEAADGIEGDELDVTLDPNKKYKGVSVPYKW